MIQTTIVVFRETLEIAIVAALLMAATRGVAGRWLWLLVGVAGGTLGAGVVALFAEAITEAFAGQGQDLFNAAVLLITVGMVAWTIAWMRRHSRTLAAEAKETGERIRRGQAPLYLLATTVGVSVLRDGSELVVFLSALQVSGTVPPIDIATGFATGVACGVAVGALLYFGVMTRSLGSVFKAVTVLLALLGAGLAAQAVGFLVSAGWLPALIDPVWDTSSLLDDSSTAGSVAHALLGYVAQPSAMQALVYAAVLIWICRLGFATPKPAA